MTIYCFDIDQTICRTLGTNYLDAKPITQRIEKINKLFSQGHTIKFLTARGSLTGINWREVTERQLASWGVNYHELHLMKPYADFYIDDKGVLDKDFDWT